MASLKDLKSRISSVNNTQKITRAMKMVAAAKLRRAQEHAEAARPYAEAMEGVLRTVRAHMEGSEALPTMLVGTGRDRNYLIVAATADRGLCGGFNSNVARDVRARIARWQAEGKTVKLVCLGKKGHELLATDHGESILTTFSGLYKTSPTYEHASEIATTLQRLMREHAVDRCLIVYNRFETAMTQIVTCSQLMPLETPTQAGAPADMLTGGHKVPHPEEAAANASPAGAIYGFEPDQATILADLVPRNFTVQLYRAMLENAASEQGARMSAMDNATRNAGDMMTDLTQEYNRKRQAAITTELIEIISGAEALS